MNYWLIIFYCIKRLRLGTAVSPLLFSLVFSCSNKTPDGPTLAEAIFRDRSNFYYVDFKNFPQQRATLPIGIFDSGTGGLAVMETILRYDGLQNQTMKNGSDGVPDFWHEDFVFLADQANMPYGNYYAEGKSALLVEHIIKDAQFLLSSRYYSDQIAEKARMKKQPAKVIVVACNTATVYGKSMIEKLIDEAGIGVKVIGVIDAGSRGALSSIQKNEDATIGVLATVGTIASMGYPTAIRTLQKEHGYTGRIEIVGQGGFGLAESIDGEPGFVNLMSTETSVDYQGPAVGHKNFPIDLSLMTAYNFDTKDYALLCASNSIECSSFQLNSPVNYARYHIVSLLERIRKNRNAPPLKAIILGCTHYPYLTNELRQILTELYNLKSGNDYVYRDVMAEDIRLIDPAQNVAQELAGHLRDRQLFNSRGNAECQFFISVPNLANPNVQIIDSTHFTHAYKYQRDVNGHEEYVKMVPFTRRNISPEIQRRLSIAVPAVYEKVRQYMMRE